MNKTLKRVLLIIGGILLLIALIIGIYYLIQKLNNNINLDVDAKNARDVISFQMEVDKEIKEAISNHSIKINDPKVILNPCKILYNL